MKTTTYTNFVRLDFISDTVIRGCLVDAGGVELAGGGLSIEFPTDVVPQEKRLYSQVVRIRWTSITPEEEDSGADLQLASKSAFEYLEA